jgi:cytochrome c peroxidase
MNNWKSIAALFLLVLLTGCMQEDFDFFYPDFSYEIPQVNYPGDNADDSLRVKLGRHLFYDPALSLDSTISCASCHIQAFGFADTASQSLGVAGRRGRRNSPSLVNVAFAPYFMREGGVHSLEMQVLVPIQEHEEFDFNILEIVDRLKQNPQYTTWSMQAYGREMDAFVLTRAIAAFERHMVSFNAPFDRYLSKRGRMALSAEAVQGMALFYSDSLACGSCHAGVLMTNFSFGNNGLYETYSDPGRFRVTGNPEDIGVFKVPSLRNVALTAPYMHDGSMRRLDDVLDHYSRGGYRHINKDGRVRGFTLSDADRRALLAFLHSLTDVSVTKNAALSKPGS